MIFCGERYYAAPVSKQVFSDLSIDLEALWHGHAQTAEHCRYQSACACPVHVVEIVTRQQILLFKLSWLCRTALLFLKSLLPYSYLVHQPL